MVTFVPIVRVACLLLVVAGPPTGVVSTKSSMKTPVQASGSAVGKGPSGALPAVPTGFRLPKARTQKQMNLYTWENVSLAIPANRAGCGPDGGVLIATDCCGMWRGTLSCMTSKSTDCPATSYVFYDSPGWPAVAIEGSSDMVDVASDRQLARFADGTVLLLHQGVRRDARTTAPCVDAGSTCRGAEYFFHSTDCGATWRLVSILDPATDGPAGDSDRYYARRTQLGHDRPELYADAFVQNRVYMTVAGIGDEVATTVLYRSDDKGVTWRHLAELPIWPGAYMTSLPSGRLYVVGWFGPGPPHHLGLMVYDPTIGSVTGPHSVGTDLARTPGTRMASGSEGITRIGSQADGDTLRVHHTFRAGTGDYGLVVRVVRVSGPVVSVLSEIRYQPPTGTSVVGPSSIQSDGLEWTPENGSDPALIYWYESRTTGTTVPGIGQDFGPGRIVGRLFDGEGAGDPFCLSLDGKQCRSWPVFTDVYGDYHRGAVWWDSRKRRLGFLSLWAEQPAQGVAVVRTNVVTVKSPGP